jgi:hypothetical protein
MQAWRSAIRLLNCRLESRLALFFFVTVACLWCATALMKVSTLASGGHFLEHADPLFKVSTAWVFALAASLEFLAAGFLFFSPDSRRRLIVCTGVTGAFWSYRLGVEFTGAHSMCGCFGKGLSWIGVSNDASEQIAFLALAYCTIGVVSIWVGELNQVTINQSPRAQTRQQAE